MPTSLRLLFLWLLAILPLASQAAFNDWFEDRTLRMDYIFSGDSIEQKISVDEMFSLPYWAGRRNHLDSLLLAGNGQILMHDAASGKLIYCQSFSSLFQEWQHTKEAQHCYKSFENCFLLPFPKQRVQVTVRLADSYQHTSSELTIPIDPKDIQIRKLDKVQALPHKKVLDNGNTKDCIDIAVLAEGYRKDQMDSFYYDEAKMEKELFEHEPFKTYKNRFNIIAVASPSEDTGVSIPRNDDWKQTAIGAQFDTFYSDRYLTTLHLKRMQDLLTGIPYEYIIILVNSDIYGGGGIYNLYMLSTIHNKQSLPVCVHEFGHSFAGLADEYGYSDDTQPYYHSTVEPWEKNITTLVNFKQKWADMIKPGTPIPTPENKKVKTDYQHVGVFEGAGYLSKGVYRPTQDCRMRVNNVPAFCPVCQRAIRDVILFYTE